MQLASLLSVHGYYYHCKNSSNSGFNSSGDMEHGLYVPLAHDVNKNGVKLVDKPHHPGKLHDVLTSGFWDNLLQVLYQVMFCLVERTTKFCIGILYACNKMYSCLELIFMQLPCSLFSFPKLLSCILFFLN